MSKSPVEFFEWEKVVLTNVRESLVCATGVPFDVIFSRNGKDEYISMRAVFYKIAYDEKINKSKIGAHTGYDHATVSHALNKFDSTYCLPKGNGIAGTKQLYDRTLEHYKLIKPIDFSLPKLMQEMNERMKRIEELLKKPDA